jgi:hypothetical protein
MVAGDTGQSFKYWLEHELDKNCGFNHEYANDVDKYTHTQRGFLPVGLPIIFPNTSAGVKFKLGPGSFVEK